MADVIFLRGGNTQGALWGVLHSEGVEIFCVMSNISTCSVHRSVFRGGGIVPKLPPAISKHDFDEYNLPIIANLFDSDKPYALSTHNRKCANKIHHICRSTQN